MKSRSETWWLEQETPGRRLEVFSSFLGHNLLAYQFPQLALMKTPFSLLTPYFTQWSFIDPWKM